MAAGDLNFNVGVDTAGAIRSVQSLNNALGSLRNAFQLTLAGISVGSIVRFSDEITSLKNRLMLLSDSQEQANTQFKAISAIAIAARADVGAVGDLYFRVARNAKELGISQAEAGQITESLAKAMSASGLSAKESAGPLLQLGQALQSGVFQGDELRSILEGLPPVAKALAEQLGVPIGALRKMGAEGQITSQDFVQAMRKARDAIEQDFAKTVPTIAQAFNQLKANVGIAFNEFQNSTQTGQNFALAIEYLGFQIYKLSKNIDSIIGPLSTFIKIAGTLVALSVAGRILSAIGGVIMGLIRGFGMLGTNIAMVYERVVAFGSTFKAAGGGLLAFAETIIFTLLPIGRLAKTLLTIAAAVGTFVGLDKLTEWFKSLGDTNSESRSELEEYRKEIAKFKTGLDTAAGAPAPAFLDPKKMLQTRQELEQIVVAYQRQNAEQVKRLELEQSLIGATEQQKATKQALADLENTYLNEINKLVDDYRKKSESKNKEDQAALPLIQKAIQGVSEAYAQQIERVRELTTQNFLLAEAERQRLALGEFSIRSQIDSSKNLQKIQDDMAKMTMSEIEKKYYDIDVAARESARSAIDAENSRRRSLKIAAMTTEEEQRYYEEAKRGTDELKQKTAELYSQGRQFSTGWKNAFQSYIDEATNAAKTAERIFQKTTSAMEDMIVNFAKTGKFEFKSFMNSILEELLRSQVRNMIAQIFQIGNVGQSGGGGGLMGSIGNLLGFANGGIIPTNAPVLVGERGPELISGASGRVVTPNEQLGMGSTYVTYNINARDARSFKDMVAADPSFIYAVSQQGAKGVPGRR